ncbi:MAG: hypothetical protein SGJ19_18920 [Planctomycetia bacterium]|nr:hypothetical protein [Planctomycetia bacterium]
MLPSALGDELRNAGNNDFDSRLDSLRAEPVREFITMRPTPAVCQVPLVFTWTMNPLYGSPLADLPGDQKHPSSLPSAFSVSDSEVVEPLVAAPASVRIVPLS